MTSETPKKLSIWKRHHTVAATLLVTAVFAAVAIGSASGSTVTRAQENNLSIRQTVAANDVSYVVTKSGEVWSQGLNNFGQLGDGTVTNSATWKRVAFPADSQPKIKKLSTKGEHVIALDTDGGLWTWGSSESSALGGGETIPVLTPKKMTVAYNFDKIATGDTFAVAIDGRGSLYTWGTGKNGELARGEDVNESGPRVIQSPNVKFTSVAAGKNTGYAVDTSGALWAWGDNSSGQFGSGTKSSSFVPIRVGGGPWKQIAASRLSDTVIGVDKNGGLWSWGSGKNSLLGVGSDWRAEQQAENQRVADQIAAIKAQDEARKATLSANLTQNRINELHAEWQKKNDNWLDQNPEPKREDYPQPEDDTEEPNDEPSTPSATSTPTPTQTPKPDPYVVAHNAWESSRAQFLSSNPEPVNASALSDSDKADIAQKLSEQFKPTDTSGIKPRVIPEPTDPAEALAPTKISSVVNFSSASVGSQNAFAVDVLGRIWGWGSDKNGQSGLGYNEDTHTHLPLKTGETSVNAVFAGDKWATAGSSNGLYTWGANSSANQLISGEKALLTPTRVRDGDFVGVTGAASTGAAIQSGGATITWGSNSHSLTGQGNDNKAEGANQIEGSYSALAYSRYGVIALDTGAGNLTFWGDDTDRVSSADSKISQTQTKPMKQTVKSFKDVAAGRLSSFAVDRNGFVWTWGLSWNSALETSAEAIPTPNRMPLDYSVKRIAATRTDVMVVTDENKTVWWGSDSPNYAPTDADSSAIGSVSEIVGGDSHFLLRNPEGDVYSFTARKDSSLLPDAEERTFFRVELPGSAQSVAAGAGSSVAVVDGTAYGWGSNASGGLKPGGSSESLNTPTKLAKLPGGKWSTVAISQTHLLGASNRDVLYTWGSSAYLQYLDAGAPAEPIYLPISEEN